MCRTSANDALAVKEREQTDVPVSMPLHDRTFDLVLLSNWEDQIIYEPDSNPGHLPSSENNLTTPANKALESGTWTQSIIWGPRAPFRDFTQLEFNHEDDVVPEERPTGQYMRSLAMQIFETFIFSGNSST